MRHRHVSISDSETEYSETDVSMEIPRKRLEREYRRRSVSRSRVVPDYSSTNTLAPRFNDLHLHRSHSTGARRTSRRDRERDRERDTYRDLERERLQPTTLIVDIKNESRNKSVDRSANKNRKQRSQVVEDNTYIDPYEETEDETVLRRQRRRHPKSTNISRDHSPLQPAIIQPTFVQPSVPQPSRDYDLVIDQRLLERNDFRQDLELQKQKAEIDRLERELARHREGQQEVRLLKEEEEYEFGISDRLRRLQKFEDKERSEEEKRRAERRYKLQQFEEAQRLEAEQRELKQRLEQAKLKELQRKLEEEAERERIKKEIRDEELKKALEEQKRLEEENAMKRAAVEEWKLAEERRMIAEREAKERKDKEFKNRLRMEFGYTEEEIEAILKKKDKKKEKGDEKEDKGKEKAKDKTKDKSKERRDDDEDDDEEQHRTTWIKVHRKHLLPDTLIAYQLPWDWDEKDGNYIIIKQWISEEFQDELFSHTRRLREGKLVTQTSNTLTEIKVNDRKKDKMYLVRKKSPRRSWIFT